MGGKFPPNYITLINVLWAGLPYNGDYKALWKALDLLVRKIGFSNAGLKVFAGLPQKSF